MPIGSYRVKAIWDKRPPYQQNAQATSGDYESIEAGPFEVRPNATTNITFHCTNRVGEAANYYQADETTLRLLRAKR